VVGSNDVPDAVDSASGIVVLDGRGDLFTRIRLLELNVAIWGTRQIPGASDAPAPATLLIIAAYGRPDWSRVQAAASRFTTIVATQPVAREDAISALEAGAAGVLDTAMTNDAMRRALLGALKGEPIYSREVLGAWLRDRRGTLRGAATGLASLTARQRQIVGLIARGATDREIATTLGITTATAQKHVANVLRRLGVPNRAAAVGLLMKDRGRAPV
jgi:DNA-binding NarL/FixJ family response regulator